MNSDDFEKRLQRQPLRSVPSEWREDILRAAHDSVPRPAVQTAKSGSLAMLIRSLASRLSPHPAAWVGLAAVWVLIFALNLAATMHSPRVAQSVARSASESTAGFKEQQKILAELLGTPETVEMDRPKRDPSRPHSELREENAVV